ARKAVDRRLLAEHLLEPARIHRGNLDRVEPAEPVTQLLGPGEGLLRRHLLIEREPDQQRQRILCQQRVCIVVVRKVQPVGHRQIVEERAWSGSNAAWFGYEPHVTEPIRETARGRDDATPARALAGVTL